MYFLSLCPPAKNPKKNPPRIPPQTPPPRRLPFGFFGGRATGKIPHKMIKSFYGQLHFLQDK
jgi:hypothetical protein